MYGLRRGPGTVRALAEVRRHDHGIFLSFAYAATPADALLTMPEHVDAVGSTSFLAL